VESAMLLLMVMMFENKIDFQVDSGLQDFSLEIHLQVYFHILSINARFEKYHFLTHNSDSRDSLTFQVFKEDRTKF
jgi:hypothetical protein